MAIEGVYSPHDSADYSYEGTMRSFANSLQRQGPGHIGILFIHDANAFTHGAEMQKVYFKQAMDGCDRALIELREQDLGKAIGISGSFNGGILATGAAPGAKWNGGMPSAEERSRGPAAMRNC